MNEWSRTLGCLLFRVQPYVFMLCMWCWWMYLSQSGCCLLRNAGFAWISAYIYRKIKGESALKSWCEQAPYIILLWDKLVGHWKEWKHRGPVALLIAKLETMHKALIYIFEQCRYGEFYDFSRWRTWMPFAVIILSSCNILEKKSKSDVERESAVV